MNLPPGNWVSGTEYQCAICPDCGHTKRAFINPGKQMGHCKRAACGATWANKQQIYEAFDLDPDDEEDWQGVNPPQQAIRVERGYKLEGLVPAWMSVPARGYLGTRGLDEAVTTQGSVKWSERVKRLVVDIDPYTQDLRPQQAQRQPRDNTKWYPSFEGIVLTEYCYGKRSLRSNLTGVVLMEGVFDLLVTRCFGFGIALMGTQITMSGILFLRQFKKIVMWTDPDTAGEKFRKKYTPQLEVGGCEVWHLFHKDPKYLRPQRKKEDRDICQAVRKFCLT